MKNRFAIQMGTNLVRFTPDGKVAVLDAIKALSESNDPVLIWESLKHNNPELNKICTEHKFGKSHFIPVVDNKGWNKIEDALLDYVIEQNCRP
jgi:hypothetical protein